MPYRYLFIFFATLSALSPWSSSQAQVPLSLEPPSRVVEDRLRLDLGVFSSGFKTAARVDTSPEEPGTPFNGEDDLGMDDANLLGQVELTLLPGTRHLIRLSSLRVRRSGSKVLERDINYEGEIYEAGEFVDSSLDLYMTGITYGYQFLRRSRGHLAATIGVHLGDVKTNAEVPGRVLREPTGETSPLALIGLEGSIDLGERWSIEGRFQYASINIDLVDATVSDSRLAVSWRLNPHLAFGLGYRRFNIEAESFDEDSAGVVDLSISGPLLFVRASL